MSLKKLKIDSPLELDCHGYITLTSFESLMITNCFEKHLSDVVLRYIGMTKCFDLFDRDSMDDYWREEILKLDIMHSFRDEPILTKGGSLCYFKLGKIHRDADLPAVVTSNGELQHRKNNKLHRGGGLPAVIYPPSCEFNSEYWIDGRLCNKKLAHNVYSGNVKFNADEFVFLFTIQDKSMSIRPGGCIEVFLP